jgi:FAD:protein FMN transferase
VPARGLREDIEEALELVDRQMSTWREDSDLTRFNNFEAGESMTSRPSLPRCWKPRLSWPSRPMATSIPPSARSSTCGASARTGDATNRRRTRRSSRRWRAWAGSASTMIRPRRELTQPGEAYLDFSASPRAMLLTWLPSN